MEIAGYTYSFDRQLAAGSMTTADAIRAHAAMGLRLHEVSDAFVDDLTPIESALRETEGRVCVYDVVCDFLGEGGSPSAGSSDIVRRGLERAARLEAPKAVVVPGKVAVGADPATVRQHYAGVVGHALDAARAHGLTLMIANLGLAAAVCGTPAHQAEIRAIAGPELRFIYDVGNYLMAGVDTIAALREVAANIGHVHFKDWRIVAGDEAAFLGQDGRFYLSVGLGEGMVPLAAALSELRAIGYDSPITVEYEGPDDPADAIRRSLEYLKPRLAA